MKIELTNITVRELVAGYKDNEEEGVVGLDGQLDIRPPFQREFVYKDKQRSAVIDTLTKGYPLNVMYWSVKDDGSYEVIDGQQRTISIAQYVSGLFSFDGLYFHNLQDDQQKTILSYELTVYKCTGTASEKLDWFQTINIPGAELTKQELRNAVYAGPWVTDAKRYFSKNGCVAYEKAHEYMNGSANRQEYLETAISWISETSIEDYMGRHQLDPNAGPLWLYFSSVIDWVMVTFPKFRKEMKGLEWGIFYNQYKDTSFDGKNVEKRVAELYKDEDVTKKKGIYKYILSGNESCLSLRAFSDGQKAEVYERQEGICPSCGKHFEPSQMEGDHITPWSEGGKTTVENCQMLCKSCNRRKSNK